MKRIALDLGGLDLLGHGHGQFRLCHDILEQLGKKTLTFEIHVLGATREPVKGLRAIFQRTGNKLIYHYYPRKRFRGSLYFEHLRMFIFLLTKRFDLYHCLHTWVPFLAPCPTMVTICDLYYEIFPEYQEARESREYRVFRWLAKKKSNLLVAISESTREDIIEKWGVSTDLVRTVQLGTKFQSNHSETVRPGLVVSHYTLEPRKNVVGLLHAFSQIASEFPESKLVLFGRGKTITQEREKTFQKMIADHGLIGRVERTGFIPDDQLQRLLGSAELFVFPSVYEGFGYPVLEAMAIGKCVIGIRTSAVAEVLGDSGILVETNDPKLLARAIKEALLDKNLRTIKSMKALERASAFDVVKMTDGYLECYRSLIF